MSMTTSAFQQPLAVYNYTYGAGSRPNRRIDFLREDLKNGGTIYARVIARIPGGEKEISKINGSQINVEMMTSTEKVKVLMDQRNGIPTKRTPDKKLSELSIIKQGEILSELEPDGHWIIEITNGFGRDPKFEYVDRLNLFNPS